MLALRIRKVASIGARKLGFRRQSSVFVTGKPPALNGDLLGDIVAQLTGEPIASVEHTLLPTSGRYLAARTYRTRVHLESGKAWSAIYKTVDVSPDQGTGFRQEVARLTGPDSIPLFVWGGIAGAKKPGGALEQYLPDVYYVAESDDRMRYEVLQEDLRGFESATKSTIGDVIRALPGVHDSLDDFVDRTDRERFWKEATAYEQAVAECIGDALAAYESTHSSRAAAAVRAQEPAVGEKHAQLLTRVPLRPIHGDLTVGNVLIGSHGFRIIDWERTTIGLAHQDLAAMVRSMPAKTQQWARNLYTNVAKDISPADHAAANTWSVRAHRLKSAAIWSVRLERNEFRAGEGRNAARILKARIERNLADAARLGDQLASGQS